MIKKIVIGTIILIATLVVALTIFLMTFDLNHYREFAQKKLSRLLKVKSRNRKETNESITH